MTADKEAASPHGALRIVKDQGANNRVVGKPPSGSGATLSFEALHDNGSGNIVEIGAGVRLNELTIMFRGSNCRLSIGDGTRLCGRITISGSGSVCTIGAGTTVERFGIVCSEGRSIAIGDRCMISYNVEMRNTDAHSIIDLASGRRINKPDNVTIGDHVWLGAYCLICKGVTIPNDVVVGQGSIVTRSIDEAFCVVAGNPARIVRTGTTWDNKLLPFEEEP